MQVERTESRASKIASGRDTTPYNRQVTGSSPVPPTGGSRVRQSSHLQQRRKRQFHGSGPGGYPLAERLAMRIEEAIAEQEAGTNPLGLVFPSPRGKHWRGSNFERRVLALPPGQTTSCHAGRGR